MATPRKRPEDLLPKGRPSTYNDDIAAEICSRLAKGQSLNSMCKLDHMPDITTVYEWMFKHPSFSQKYAKAREDQADTMADEIQEIVDEEPERVQSEYGSYVDSGYVANKRLRIDARKWIASKLKPKRYGDKVQQEVSGPDGSEIKTSLIIKFETPPGSK